MTPLELEKTCPNPNLVESTAIEAEHRCRQGDQYYSKHAISCRRGKELHLNASDGRRIPKGLTLLHKRQHTEEDSAGAQGDAVEDTYLGGLGNATDLITAVSGEHLQTDVV